MILVNQRDKNLNTLEIHTYQLSCLRVENFDITVSCTYKPISHALLENMSCCSHIWQMPGKYVICKRVICTQSNNGLKRYM